jgi:protein-S-isoprenylcysteine O-methyltransferase Ste14
MRNYPSSPPLKTQALGTLLFRFRSFTPVPVILALGALVWWTRGTPGPGGALVDAVLDVAGLLVAFAGQALRFYTLGLVPEGTSGQGFQLEASTLNTRGPYAHVRNPLYLGNLGIVLGLLLVVHNPWAYPLTLGFFFGEYFFIIRAEEAFLRQRFGEAFEDFCARVPRWIPRLSPAFAGRLRSRFDVSRALKKEHNPFAAWASGMILLWGWEKQARGELDHATAWTLGITWTLVLLAFAGIKTYKRGWLRRA